jgi:hypothetical protein
VRTADQKIYQQGSRACDPCRLRKRTRLITIFFIIYTVIAFFLDFRLFDAFDRTRHINAAGFEQMILKFFFWGFLAMGLNRMRKAKRRNAMRYLLLLTVAISSLFFQADNPAWAEAKVTWEKYDGGGFTIDKPIGWIVDRVSDCSSLAFIVSDPSCPIRRTFYFGEVGPFYLTEAQRQVDYRYLQMGGFKIGWIDMPVIEPLTVENFFMKFNFIANSEAGRNSIRNFPALENFSIVSSAPAISPFGRGSDSKTIRAVFRERQMVGQGIFSAVVNPFVPFDGSNPGVGTAIAYSCTGISSLYNDFSEWEPILTKILASLTFAPGYIERCMAVSNARWAEVSKINKTWDDISDIIDKVWKNKSESDDRIAQKNSDTIRGVQRMRDRETGEEYEMDIGKVDDYMLHPERYSNRNLEPVN